MRENAPMDLLDFTAMLQPPMFDRIVVSDIRLFSNLEEFQPGAQHILLGWPVMIDSNVPTNVIELRLGRDVYKEILINYESDSDFIQRMSAVLSENPTIMVAVSNSDLRRLVKLANTR